MFLICKNLSPLHIRMICALKFGWNWPCRSWEEDVNSFLLFFYYPSPSWPFIWTYTFTQGCFEPSLVEISCMVLEKKILNFINVQLSPLGKKQGPSFEQTWIPFTHGCFVPSLVDNGPVVWENKMKIWKVYRQMDDRGSEKFTWTSRWGKLKSTDLINALPKYTKYIEHITFINYYINLEAFNGKYNQ